jgi:hypothetical protein
MSGQHARFSPSSAYRVVTCPASLQHNTNGGPPSWFAVEGTIAHAIHARCLDEGTKAISYLGRKPHQFLADDELNPDEWALVPEGWSTDRDFCEAIQQSIDWILDLAGPDPDILVEQRVDISEYTPVGEQFGTCDVGIITSSDRLIICDLKFGRGIRVDADHNHQLALYALGFIERYGWMENFHEVSVCVSQPRIDHFDEWYTSVPQLKAFGAEIKAGFTAALSDNPPYNPDEHACKFCQYKAECPALYNAVMDMFADPPAPTTLPADHTSRVLGKRKLIRDYLDAVEDHAVNLLMHDKPVAGYKLVEGRSSRKWSASDTKVAHAINSAGFKAYTEVLLSPAAALKLLPKAQQEPLLAMIEKVPGKPTLTEESDKRSAWDKTATSMFD